MNKAKLILLSLLMAPMLAFSDAHTHVADEQKQTAQAEKSAMFEMSEGEIRRINKETGKVTIKHGPLQNLNMPGMTMLFSVQDPSMIDLIKEGDKIKFIADKVEGVFVVRVLELRQ